MNNQNLAMTNEQWKNKYLIGGAAVGAVIGLVTAYFLVRNSEENRGGPPDIRSIDIVKSGVGVVGLIRAIASLGD